MASNTVRDIALSLGAGSLIVLTTMFGMKQCSGDEKAAVSDEKKTPKIEIVNDNKIVVDGKADVKNKTAVIVGDSIVIRNNNDIVVKGDDNKCNKDTLIVKVVEEKKKPKPQPKPQPKPVVRDTVYLPAPVVPQDTVKPVVRDTTAKSNKVTIAWGYVCTLNNSHCK